MTGYRILRADQIALNTGSPPRGARPWLRRATVAGSLFFLVKGLAWLAAGYWLLVD